MDKKARNARILELWQAAYPAGLIAALLYVSLSTVYYVLRQAGKEAK